MLSKPSIENNSWVREFINEKGEWVITEEQKKTIMAISPGLYDYLQLGTPLEAQEIQLGNAFNPEVIKERTAKELERQAKIREAEKNNALWVRRGVSPKETDSNAVPSETSEFVSSVREKGMEKTMEERMGASPSTAKSDGCVYCAEGQEGTEACASEVENAYYFNQQNIPLPGMSKKQTQELRERLIEDCVEESAAKVRDERCDWPDSLGNDEARRDLIDECLKEVGDFWSCEGKSVWRDRLVEHYSVKGMEIMRSYKGILDKDVFIDKLESVIRKDSGKVGISDAMGEKMRSIARDAAMLMRKTTVLEWHNLMMTGKGYTRIARIFSELLMKGICEQLFETPINIGCETPKVWSRLRGIAKGAPKEDCTTQCVCAGGDGDECKERENIFEGLADGVEAGIAASGSNEGGSSTPLQKIAPNPVRLVGRLERENMKSLAQLRKCGREVRRFGGVSPETRREVGGVNGDVKSSSVGRGDAHSDK